MFLRLSSFLTALVHAEVAKGGPLGSILNPLQSALEELLSGEGLIEGTLGQIGGTLGVQQEFDYVVVGGGTAGNAIGVRLAEEGFSVAIIEAGIQYELGKPILGTTPAGAFFGTGGKLIDSIPAVDWQFLTEPQAGLNNRKIHYAQGRTLGGSSALNFMIHHRATKGAYAQWAEAVGDDSYLFDNFLPYFKKSVTLSEPNLQERKENATTVYDETVFEPAGTGGPIQVGYSNWVATWATWLEKGLQALGLERNEDFSSGKLLGYHYSQAFIRASDQTRSSSAEYIYYASDNAATQRNLKVFTQTLAKKVVFDKKKKATGVDVSMLGALPTYRIKARKEVIVSAGSFKSPQLLMLSGIGPEAELKKHGIPVVQALEGVGQNMWDHVMFGPSYRVNFPTLDETIHNPVKLGEALLEYALNARGPLASNIIEFLGWEKLPAKYREGWSAETREALDWFADDWPEVEHISANGWIGDFAFPIFQQPLDGGQYATNLGAMVAPLSRGNVTLRSANPLEHPRINPNWLTHPADVELAVSWYKRLREVWDTPELRSIRVGDEEDFPGRDKATDAELLEVIRESAITVWHAACSCKMGTADDDQAVVDNKARVFGVEGLRVVDASAFPILPPGHPTSTVYALAEKIAAAIAEEQ